MHQRPGIEVVGLTSAANKAFCESLGCYHRVLAYEELDQVRPMRPACTWTSPATASCGARSTRALRSCATTASIGGTHVEQLAPAGTAKELPGPRATFFFAPAQIKKRTEEWGADELRPAHGAGLAGLSREGGAARDALARRPSTTTAPEAVQAAYAQVLSGRGDPRIGHILSLSR